MHSYSMKETRLEQNIYLRKRLRTEHIFMEETRFRTDHFLEDSKLGTERLFTGKNYIRIAHIYGRD